jgi:hypothetical protein
MDSKRAQTCSPNLAWTSRRPIGHRLPVYQYFQVVFPSLFFS